MAYNEFVLDNEAQGIEYLRKITKQGWTVTPTDYVYDKWDATVSNGTRTFTVENKVRYISKETAEKGLLLDTTKVCEEIDWYIEYLPSDMGAYIISYNQIVKGIEDKQITLDRRQASAYTWRDRDVKCEKVNWLIPLRLFRRVDIPVA